MIPYITAAGVLFIISVFLLIRFMWVRNKITELKDKTEFAVKGEDMMLLSFSENSDLGKVADNFNTLVKKYIEARKDRGTLLRDKEDKSALDQKVRDFESSMSQLTLITDIGRKITASLNIEDFMQIVYDYVRSSMDVDEVELMYYKGENPIFLSMDSSGHLQLHKNLNVEIQHSLMFWSLENHRDVYLNDAKRDYGQYIAKPVKSFTNKEPSALICVPLLLKERKIGALGIMSVNKNVYNNYHLEFIKTLGSYLAIAIDNSNVYQWLEEGKAEIESEKSKTDALLLNILPAEVADELKKTGHSKAQNYENVSVLFTDFVNFTGISESMSPADLVAEIDECFKNFDAIMEKHGLEKIKTIGDAYLAVCGLPNSDPTHAEKAVSAAIDIRQFMKDRNKKGNSKINNIRIGINSGPLVAGIVGVKKFAYDIWGDTVNTAARMEEQSESGKINISGKTYELVSDKFDCTYRGKIEAKNKGEIDMYFVEGPKS
ncbi:MAG: GAF domain-containing protein [Bacteroidetes bacterium]|nr:GAF domain-containing protein [Bacteroidota bacterium]